MIIGSTLWHLIRQSDTVTKLIVFSLILLSAVCVALAIYVRLALGTQLRDLKMRNDALMQQVHDVPELLSFGTQHRTSVLGVFIAHVVSAAHSWGVKLEEGSRFSYDQRVTVHDLLEAAVADRVVLYEKHIQVLAAAAAISPLVGLFGTVWGLIHAFVAIGAQQSADLCAVAPGISEALITTLAGLMVAIPALVLFHYLQSLLRQYEHELLRAVQRVIWIVGVS